MAVCKNCGSQVVGNFCSSCGTPANSKNQSIYDTLGKGSDIEKTIGFLSTLLKILSSPIQNTLNIAFLVTFHHKAFLLKCIAIHAAIGIFSKLQTTNSIVSAILGTTGMFVLVFIQIVLTYYGLRFFSRTYRSGSDFAKLICIAQGVAFLFMGAGEACGLMFGVAAYTIAMLIQVIILVPYWALVLGRFWNLNPVLAYIVYLLSMLPAAILIWFAFPLIQGFIYL